METEVEDRWATYLCNVNSELASIAVNASLHDDTVRRQNEHLLWVWVELLEPRWDGLSSSEEAPELYKIEDAVALQLTDAYSAIFAGRITTQKRREFYFYGNAPSHSDDLKSRIAKSMRAFPRHSWSIGCQPDPAWSQYLDLLYPSPEQWQSIGNRQVLGSLAQQGDDHSIDRLVLHWAFFETPEARAKFIAGALAAGFDLDKQYQTDLKLSHAVCVSKVQNLLPATIDEASLTLVHLAQENLGDYDGWETQATSAPV